MTRDDVCARCGHPRSLHETVPTDHRFKAPYKKGHDVEPPISRDELRAIIRAELRAELERAGKLLVVPDKSGTSGCGEEQAERLARPFSEVCCLLHIERERLGRAVGECDRDARVDPRESVGVGAGTDVREPEEEPTAVLTKSQLRSYLDVQKRLVVHVERGACASRPDRDVAHDASPSVGAGTSTVGDGSPAGAGFPAPAGQAPADNAAAGVCPL